MFIRVMAAATLVTSLLLCGAGCGGANDMQDTIDPQTQRVTTFQPGAAPKSCWVDLDTERRLCVNDGEVLADAVLAKYGVLIHSDDNSTAPSDSAIAAFRRNGVQPMTTVLIGRIYEHSHYGGAHWDATTTGGCGKSIRSLGSIGWNDKLSSFKSYSGCTTTICEHDNFGPTCVGGKNTTYVGDAMNDRASSIKWH